MSKENKYFIQENLKHAEVFYCKNFFSHIADDLFEKLDNEISWSVFPVKIMGKTFNQPRDSSYIADEKRPYKYGGYDRIPENWTETLKIIRDILQKVVNKINPEHPKLNAVLCNRYKTGTEYIGPHSDAEDDLAKNAFIVSVSLGAERDFIFHDLREKNMHKICLENGSVLLMGKNCQKNYKHSLPKRMGVKSPKYFR
jgi:alkylated DNA repair dioxygenase AlkB